MVEFSSSSWENETHKVDSPFNEDAIKNFQGGPNFGTRTAGKFKENGQ